MEADDLIDEEDYRVVKVLKAMANGLRFEIINRLVDSPRSVSALANDLDRSVSSISHQLKTLRSNDLVRAKSEGSRNVYRPKRRDVIDKILELRPLLKREPESPE